jgi:hypothetical protein
LQVIINTNFEKNYTFLLITIFTNAQWSISTSERNALISIYNQTDGANGAKHGI